MNRLQYLIGEGTNPYKNIAVEEYLLMHTEPGTGILYLWQNRKTVVIGRNQNAWRECRVEALEADGGFLARRMSGGGAVFHDLGNLNFTFLARKEDYDLEKQTEVILRAVQSFGIPARRTGRNDLTVKGRKFSGNAFYTTGDFCYHHGTVLIDADKQEMSKYLNVSREKLQSKGVESVKSRVGNLSEWVPSLTVEQMRQALILAFGQVYGGTPEAILPEALPKEKLEAGETHFSSWDWLYGRKIPFNAEASGRYDWGEVQMRLEISEGIIRDAVVWTDTLDVELARIAEHLLCGLHYRDASISRVFDEAAQKDEARKDMFHDLVRCLTEKKSGEERGSHGTAV